jgi:type II secretory pathway predicted ATPase ExeA
MSSEILNDSRLAFEDAPDARFFFASSATQAVWERLLSDLGGNKGVLLLVGAPGTGKTLLLRRLEQTLSAAGRPVVLPGRATASFDELLEACCEKLDVLDATHDRMGHVRALATHLLERLEPGTTAVILIDDAQSWSDAALEDLSWLTDLDIDGRKLVQVVLAGRPELVPRLCVSRLPFVQESAIAYYGLEPLGHREVGAYIRQRLQAAQVRAPEVFSATAIERIASYARGVPRVVNQICAAAVDLAGRSSGTVVSADTVEAAVRTLSERGTLETQSEAFAPLAPDDRSQTRAAGDSGAAGEADTEIGGRSRISDEVETGPALASFPRNLVVPTVATGSARRRALFAPIAILFLAGVILGALGILAQDYRSRPPMETSPTAKLSEDDGTPMANAATKEQKAFDPGTAITVAAATEVRPLAEPVEERADPAGAPDVRPPPDRTPARHTAQDSDGEYKAMPLDTRAAEAHADGPEILSLGHPAISEGASLSTGQEEGNGDWTQHPDDPGGLTPTPPVAFSGRFDIAVAASAGATNGVVGSAAVTSPKKPTRAPADSATATAKGDFVIQLAALRSAAGAEREAERLKDRFPELLGNAQLKVYEAEVNGVPYFRVRTASVRDKAEVFQTCARLKNAQQDCMVLQQFAAVQPVATPAGEAGAVANPMSLLPSEVTIAMMEASSSTSAAGSRAADIAVRDLVMARDVTDREPVGVSRTFSPKDERAFAYAKVDNPAAPTRVSFVWLYDDALYATVDMEVGTSVRWRTWSSSQLWLGAWRVQIVSTDGDVLAETAFTVE